MAVIDFNRRMLLRLGLGASAGFAMATPALGQTRKLFGIKLPQAVVDALPPKILSVTETADAVIALEREADLKQLPKSLLQLDVSAKMPPSDASFYELILPRLVALIDRSEFRNTEFADKAGGLLAQLHATQHEVPEGWRSFGIGQGFGAAGNNRLSLDPQQDGAMPPILDFPAIPGAPPVTDAPPAALPPAEVLPTGTMPPAPPQPGITPPTLPGTPSDTASDTVPETPAKPEPEENKPMSRRRDFASLSAEYGRMFASVDVRPERMRMANWHLTMLRNSRSRYQAVGDVTGVPWYFIGIIHGLEASFNFRAHLHNGDFPLSSRTRQVPAGRPRVWLPPADWGSSARDALALLGFTGQRDWSLERTLYRLEAYNGLGYRSYGVPTPYLWSFSNHYQSGKFVADGKWNAAARSQQCGAAVMLKLLSDAGDINLASGEPA
jgi:lysozyme family protein